MLDNHASLRVQMVYLGAKNDIPESSNRRQYHQKHSKYNADLKNRESTSKLDNNRLSSDKIGWIIVG